MVYISNRELRTQYDAGMSIDEITDALNLGLYIGITQAGSGQKLRPSMTKLQEIERNINDATSVANAISAAQTAGQALHAPFGTTDATGISSQTVSSDLILLGRHDATIDANDTETFLIPGGGDIVIAGVTLTDFLQVIDGPQAATPVTPYLRVDDTLMSSGFNGIFHESPLTAGLITFSRFPGFAGAPIKIGYNNHDLQDNWTDLRIIGNLASDITQVSAIDHYFAQTNGKRAITALNIAGDVQSSGVGESWVHYEKQRWSVSGLNIWYDATTTGSANPALEQIKGAARGVTNDGVEGYSNLRVGNLLLGSGVGRGAEIHTADASLVGYHVENCIIGVIDGSSEDGFGIVGGRIRGPAAAAGNYGIHVSKTGDDSLIGPIAIHTVERAVNIGGIGRNLHLIGVNAANCDGIAIQQAGTTDLVTIVGCAVDGADRAIYLGGTITRALIVGNNFDALADNDDLTIQLDGSVKSGLVTANAPTEGQTTDANAKNIYRVNLPTNTHVWIEATVIGITNDWAQRIVQKIGGFFYNAAGTATQEGSTDAINTKNSAWGGSVPTGAAFAVTGSTVLVQFTGKADTTINVSCNVTMQFLT